VILVPYAEFVARRDRRLRVLAELRAEARAQTIEGEVLEGEAGERPGVDLSLTRPEWRGPDLDDQDLVRTHDPVLDAAHHHFSGGIEGEHNGVAGLDS